LIEGAHRGAGLGDRFLRHIERTRLLLHLVDLSGLSQDPIADLQVVTRELEAYQPAFASRPRIVVATKLDALEDPARLAALEQFCRDAHLEFHIISAITRKGVPELLHAIRRKLFALRLAERNATSTARETNGAAPTEDAPLPEFSTER